MMSVRFEGGADLAKALNSLSSRVSRAIVRDVLMTVGEPMRQVIADHAPREPGAPDLADHMQIAATRVGEPGDVSVGIGVPKWAYYDWFNEYGTVKMGARPFYRPGFDSMVNRTIAETGDAIWTELASKGLARQMSFTAEPVSHFGPFL